MIFMLSLCGNVAFFLADGVTKLRLRDLNKKNNTTYSICSSIEEFRKQVYDVNLNILLTEKRPEAPVFQDGVVDRIMYNLGCKNNTYPFFYWGEPNWLLVATLEDAILHNDKKSIMEMEEIFKRSIENIPIEHIGQCMCGNVAILLYQETGNKTYKSYADKMFEWCKKHDTQYGISDASYDCQLIDGYGMYLPFLNKYANVFNDSTAFNLATKQVELATKYFIDEVGGLPAHIYSLSSPHIKQGSCNWGRGISWFLLGLVDIDYSLLSDSALMQINKMDTALCSVWNDFGQFNQFVGESGEIDLTATLPIIYYLSHKGLIKLESEDLLAYSRFSDCGLLYHGSCSNLGKHVYTPSFGPNILSQAFMLKLINERNKKYE